MSKLSTIGNPRPRNLGFLDLPPELRLKIYSHLLINRTEPKSRRKTFHDWGHVTVWLPSRLTTFVTINASRSGVDPSTVSRETNPNVWEEALHPEILSTCRTIQQEAAVILYGKNVFNFWVRVFGYFLATFMALLQIGDISRKSHRIPNLERLIPKFW